MKITLLGTGDTVGTPRVGCDCPVCTAAIKAGVERLRTSILVEHEGKHLLIDTSPDLRHQLLATGSPHIDAVIWTHGHYDHFAGYNDFYRVQRFPPVYGAPEVLDYLTEQFKFLPIESHPIQPYVPFELFGLKITLVEVIHPPTYTTGIVIECCGKKIVHTADTSAKIPQKTLEAMEKPDLLFVDALMPPGIHIGKHMNYDDACALATKLHAKDYRCVHCSHKVPLDWDHLGRDGETFEIC